MTGILDKFHVEHGLHGARVLARSLQLTSGCLSDAEVDANISALAIVIGGTVRGNLSASTRVEILPTGVLTGSLKTGSFSAADGASVKGEVWVEPPATRAAGGSLNS